VSVVRSLLDIDILATIRIGFGDGLGDTAGDGLGNGLGLGAGVARVKLVTAVQHMAADVVQ
jgi:hypothetical protein